MRTDNVTIAPADDVLSTLVGNEIILLDAARSEYFGLRGAAVRMWELIEQASHTSDDIVRRLTGEFRADEATIRHDVEAMLGQLSQRGLIREGVPDA